MTHLAKNPFNDTLAELEKSMPAEFTLEVDMGAYRYEMHEARQAQAFSSAMENMKYRAVEMGYRVDLVPDHNNFRWLYKFKLTAEGLARKAQVAQAALVNAQPDPTPAV